MSAAISSRIRLSAKTLICFATLFLIGGASGATAESDSGHAFTTTETVQPIFDDRVWTLGYAATRGDQTVREYVLSGETVENWSELITVQSFTGSQGTTAPVEAMRRARDATLHDCPDAMWNLIRESETEVLYESREEGCLGPVDSDDQYGIFRIIKGSLGLQVVSYANKRQPYLPEAERSEWIDRLSRAELIVQVGVADDANRGYPLMPTKEFKTYEGHKQQFLIDIPTGWFVHDQWGAITGTPSRTGMVIFSEENLANMQSLEQQAGAMVRTATGEIPSFFVDRHPKNKKMSCDHFEKGEIKSVTKMIKRGSTFDRDRKVISPLTATPISFGGCRGIRLKGETEKQDGTRWVVDVYAASDGEFLYLFSLRNVKENYEKNLSVYEKAMSTVKLTSVEG